MGSLMVGCRTARKVLSMPLRRRRWETCISSIGAVDDVPNFDDAGSHCGPNNAVMDAPAANYTSTATWLHLHALHLETLRPSIDDGTAVALNRKWSPKGLFVAPRACLRSASEGSNATD